LPPSPRSVPVTSLNPAEASAALSSAAAVGIRCRARGALRRGCARWSAAVRIRSGAGPAVAAGGVMPTARFVIAVPAVWWAAKLTRATQAGWTTLTPARGAAPVTTPRGLANPPTADGRPRTEPELTANIANARFSAYREWTGGVDCEAAGIGGAKAAGLAAAREAGWEEAAMDLVVRRQRRQLWIFC